MSKRARRALWLVAGAVVVVGPPALYLGRRVDEGMDLLVVLSGLAATVAMVLTTVGASRIRAVTTALGINRVMRGHQWWGVAAAALVVVHLVLAVVELPARLDLLSAPTALLLGWAAFAGMVLLSGAAAWGRRRGTRYEWWARLHILAAALALVLAGLHIFWVGNLVSDPIMRPVCIALAVLLLGVLARRWVWRPLFSRRGAYVVYGMRPEGGDVATLALTPVFRRRALRFAPGQFIWLRLHRRVVGVQEHPFTIASSAEVTGRLELTVRASGDFSSALARLQPGRKVWLDGPQGSFTPDVPERVDGLVLIAGGVGITPMMSMLRTLAERGDDRQVRLVLAERADQPLFGPELEVLSRRLALDVARTHGRRVDADLLGELLPRDRGRLEYYVCGPPSLLQGALAGLGRLGVPPVRIHSEQFGWSGPLPVAASTDPGDPHPPAADEHDAAAAPGPAREPERVPEAEPEPQAEPEPALELQPASGGHLPPARRPRTSPTASAPSSSTWLPSADSPADRFPTRPSIPVPRVLAAPEPAPRAASTRGG